MHFLGHSLNNNIKIAGRTIWLFEVFFQYVTKPHRVFYQEIMSSWTVWILFHMYRGKLFIFVSISHFKITGYNVMKNAELYCSILYQCTYLENNESGFVCIDIFHILFKAHSAFTWFLACIFLWSLDQSWRMGRTPGLNE